MAVGGACVDSNGSCVALVCVCAFTYLVLWFRSIDFGVGWLVFGNRFLYKLMPGKFIMKASFDGNLYGFFVFLPRANASAFFAHG